MAADIDSMIDENHPSTVTDALRERPALWRSYYHVLYTISFCVIGISLALTYVSNFTVLELLVVPATFLTANFIEYFIHRWPMHHKYRGAEFMLRLHMLHHTYFFEETYKIEAFEDFAMIVFPPAVLNTLAFLIAPVIGAGVWVVAGADVTLVFLASTLGYYLLMQIIHVFCHLDDSNPLTKVPGIRYLWRHHLIHHTRKRMTKTNFNFIVPVADICFGTNSQDLEATQGSA